MIRNKCFSKIDFKIISEIFYSHPEILEIVEQIKQLIKTRRIKQNYGSKIVQRISNINVNCPNLNDSQKSIKKIQLESFDNYQKLSTLRNINSRGRDGNPNQMLNSILANWIVPKANTQDRKERTARILFKLTKKEMDTYIENEDNKVSYPSNHEEVCKIATMLHRKTNWSVKSRSQRNTNHEIVHFPKNLDTYKNNLMRLCSYS